MANMGSRVYHWLKQRPKRWVHLSEVPVPQLSIYLLAVFFLFSVFGFYADIMSGGRQQYAVVFVIAIFSGLNAALWIMILARLGRGWICVLCVFQIFSPVTTSHLTRWVTTQSLPLPLKTPATVQFAATAILIAVILSYICFVVYIRNTGRESYRLKAELALAHSIQKTLVPLIQVDTHAFEVFGVSEPSEKVGGDLVDLVTLSNGDVVAYLADIAGHGLQAGILMGMVKTAARTALISDGNAASEAPLCMLMHRLNVVLPQVKEAQMYATFTGLRLNLDGNVFYGMAASPPLLHWSAATKTITRIQEEQFPLGLLQVADFPGHQLPVESDDILLIATDGIYEVASERHVEYGIEALEKLLAQHAGLALQPLASLILREVRAYGRQLDDQTILLVRKKA